MRWTVDIGRILGSFWLLQALLFAPPASAQGSLKPAVSNTPSAPPTGSDTTHLVLQHTQSGVHAGSRVAVRYTGFLPDGHVFDTTSASGGPLRFKVGRGEVIPGWDELLPQLTQGSRVRAWIPAALAYGTAGVRDPDDDTRFLIPPNTELVFELYILSVR